MKIVRAITLALYVLGLAFGAYVAAAVVMLPESMGGWSRIVVAMALLCVVAAYGAVMVRRGFAVIAPVLFAFSYIAVGVVVDVNTRAMAKHFAPADPKDVPMLYTVTGAEIIAVVLIAAACCWWVARRSRYPLV